MILGYLKRKKLPLDVSDFVRKDLGDIVMEMQAKNSKSISLTELIDIYSYQNQIFEMREIATKRLSKIAYRRWWRSYSIFLKSDYEKAKEMKIEFEEKQQGINDIVNNRNLPINF